MSVLRCEAVSKRYGEIEAVRGVSLTVNAREMVAVTGPSGSGKSTLLALLAGLEDPDAGQVWVADQALSSLDETARARLRRSTIGFVFQTFNLIPVLSLAENAALPQVLDGVPERLWRPRVTRALEQVGLAARADHLPSQASVGEQQRAAIARVLATDPKLVFADEPTGSLDSTRGRAVMTLLRLACEAGAAVVVVTHDPTTAAFADREYRLTDGILA